MAELDVQTQGLTNYKGRLLNHVELVYWPGERHLVGKLFTALGCTVIDGGATQSLHRRGQPGQIWSQQFPVRVRSD
jgi:hypothetical protein